MDKTEMTENMYNILDEIRQERVKQTARWGGADEDAKNNSPSDFVLYITSYATRWFKGGLPPHNTSEYRENMVKVATLALAAVEAYDYANKS